MLASGDKIGASAQQHANEDGQPWHILEHEGGICALNMEAYTNHRWELTGKWTLIVPQVQETLD